ncbi:MAG: Asp-tRNA(Asn)/Glu-tRNA(Gln) amidotransferase subunit GatB [Candidatus Jorgensenbacteria bacterium]|nr:Asp-tRNA(Asn)/Glu-tRNA(Gln) amidotransferase subunit GatB [Candidatus Jorgensenbacteria bacterium]
MYIPTIGLEIHVELRTNTKMFCQCKNATEETGPNVNVCPICLAHPGALPVANRAAIESVIRLGYALHGKIAERSHFDRKSYFYPDLPKGYQISQYEAPLVSGGMLKDVRITRVHLEEDTARLAHVNGDTLVDYNRAGVPLMELVTEPDIKNAEEATAFAKELQLILRYLRISDADMEKGQMRVEANISVSKKSGELGTKVEVKNLNSFRAVHDAIKHELERQEALLESGGKVIQETRGWDDKNGVTKSQRSKESAHDYRYFPEPDLPEMDLSELDLPALKESVPELPEEKRSRLVSSYGISREDAEVLITDKPFADYFEQAVSELKEYEPKADTQTLYNYLTSDLQGIIKEKSISISDVKILPPHLARLVAFIAQGKLSSRLAKDMLPKMFETGIDPEELMKDSGVAIISDEKKLKEIVLDIIEKNPKVVEDYKKGKGNALQFLIGQGMAKTKGQADPAKLQELLKKELS